MKNTKKKHYYNKKKSNDFLIYKCSPEVRFAYWNEEILLSLCKQYNLRGEIRGDSMFVSTGVGNWYFSLDDTSRQMKLYHENLFRSTTSNKFGNGYHLQHHRFCNPVAILEYIYKHDRNGFTYMKTTKDEKNRNRVYNRAAAAAVAMAV